MLGYFIFCQTLQLIGQYQPVFGSVQKVVGLAAAEIFTGLVVGNCDAYLFGHVSPAFCFESSDHRLDVVARAEDIIDDKQSVIAIQIFKKILQPVHSDALGVIDHLAVTRLAAVRGPYRDMVGFNPKVLKAFLDVDTHRRSTSPDTDDKVGPKAAVIDADRELKGLLEQLLLFNKLLFHVTV